VPRKMVGVFFLLLDLFLFWNNLVLMAASGGNWDSNDDWGGNEWAEEKKPNYRPSSGSSSAPTSKTQSRSGSPAYAGSSANSSTSPIPSSDSSLPSAPRGGHVDYFAKKGRENDMKSE